MVAPAPARGDIHSATVLDASVAAAWCFEDETSSFTEGILDDVVRHGALVPSLWMFEMANVLTMAERRGRIDEARVSTFLAALLALPLQVDRTEPASLMPLLVRVARAQQLTAYDAAYLELAMRTGSPLATRDVSLRSAAERVGVPLHRGQAR